MNQEISSTENKILEAAKKEFILNGLKGTSMQQIADAAGINKSLLHYYFRSKEKLFGAVFSFALQKFVPQIQDVICSGESIFIKIGKIVDEYVDMLETNPFIPVFVLHEINRNPQRPYDIFIQPGLKPQLIVNNLISEKDKNLIKPTDPVSLMINIIALCVFPVAASPLLEKILFDNNRDLLQQFLHRRKTEIKSFIIDAIKL